MKTTITTKLIFTAAILATSGLTACFNSSGSHDSSDNTEVVVVDGSPDDTVVDDTPDDTVADDTVAETQPSTVPRGNPLRLDDGVIVVHAEFVTRLSATYDIVWQTEVEGQLEDMVWSGHEALWVISKASSSDTLLEIDPSTGEITQKVERDEIFDFQASQNQLALMSRHEGTVALERFELGSLNAIDRFENPDSFVLTQDGGILVSMGGGSGYAVMAFDNEGQLLGQSADFVDPPFIYQSSGQFIVLGQTEQVSSANPYDLFGYGPMLDTLWSHTDVFNADVDPESGLVLISESNADRTGFVLSELSAETGETTTVVAAADWGFYQPAAHGDAHYYVPYGPAEVPTFINRPAEFLEVQLPGLVWPELAVAEGHGLLVRPTSGIRDFDSDLMLLSPEGEVVFQTQIDVRSDRPIRVEESELTIIESNELVVLDMTGSELARVALTD